MFTINLHNLLFFAHHGVHEEERILGNNFVVNVSLSFKQEENVAALEQTINYAAVFSIIKQRMSIPTALLETLTQELAQQIKAFDDRISFIAVSVEKKAPPIPGMEGSVGVTWSKDF